MSSNVLHLSEKHDSLLKLGKNRPIIYMKTGHVIKQHVGRMVHCMWQNMNIHNIYGHLMQGVHTLWTPCIRCEVEEFVEKTW